MTTTSLDDWVQSKTNNRGGRVCKTCRLPRNILDQIEANAARPDDRRISYRLMHQWLREQSFELSVSSVQRHCIEHVPVSAP